MKKVSLFLLSLVLLAPSAAQALSFPDQYDQQLNEDAISYLKDTNAVQGYPDGDFKAENRINRAEFTKILIEAVYADEEIDACQDTPFSDVPDGAWFEKYVCMAEKNNIVDGYLDGTFGPSNFINFAESSKIVAETYDSIGSDDNTNKEWFAKYVKGLEEKNAIPSTVAFFDEPITRGEMAELTYRLDAKDTSQNSLTYQEITDPLPTFSSCSALEERINEYLYEPPLGQVYMLKELADDEVFFNAPEAVPMAADGEVATGALNQSKVAEDFSETNVQVEGVDEADIIKNDGKYIYMIKGDEVRIIEAYPGDQMEELAPVTFNLDGAYHGSAFYPQEMYVSENRLTVIGESGSSYHYTKPGFLIAEDEPLELLYPPYSKRQTEIHVFDITDRSQPELVRDVSFEGYYKTSRRIGDQVYLVLDNSPTYWPWDTDKGGAGYLPSFRDSENPSESMVDCTDVHYFPGYETPNYLITTSVNINNPNDAIDREVILGSSDNVYVSQDNLYVANTVYDRDTFSDWDWSIDEAESHVFKFELNNGRINFDGRGEVPGRILNQFSMDENDGYFRIATTKGNIWDGRDPSTNNVYVLDSNMKQVGELEGLAPGEEIKSARFVGDRLYMVTFVQVDPLFVIDLKDPRNPDLLGQLKIPGFSEYIHPYDENHIIGFGRETSLSDKGNVQLEGFKMSLFDVTDPTNPEQKFVEVIGDNGTYSELLYNHKALLFDKEKDLLAFPINIVELMKPQSLQCENHTLNTCPMGCMEACVPSKCVEDEEGNTLCTDDCGDAAGSCVAPTYDQYQTTFSGAVVYDIDLENGFTERGRITHLTAEDIEKMGDYWYSYGKNIQRILYIGEYLYTVAQGGIQSADLQSVEAVDFVQLEGEEEFYPVDVMF